MPSPFNELINYVDKIFSVKRDKRDFTGGTLRYFYNQLYKRFIPDINGYVLIFMVPPDLSGYRLGANANQEVVTNEGLYGDYPMNYYHEVAKLVTFAGIDFTPPTQQISSDKISARVGGIPYATEVTESEQCSITFIDTIDLDVFQFHHMWLEYIRDVLHGWIQPAKEYLQNEVPIIDYMGSIYIVKYRPTMRDITYIGKAMGVFPQGLPSKELIGARTSNEITTLPINYYVSAFREATWMETKHWLVDELQDYILTKFEGSVDLVTEASKSTDPDEISTQDPSDKAPDLSSVFDSKQNTDPLSDDIFI